MKVQIEVSWYNVEGKRSKEQTKVFDVPKEHAETLVKIEEALNETCQRRYHVMQVGE